MPNKKAGKDIPNKSNLSNSMSDKPLPANRKKRQKEIPGSIFKVIFDDPFFTYGRIVTGGVFAFYDCKTENDLPIEEIINKPILFYSIVSSYSIKSNIWEIIGNIPLEDYLLKNPKFGIKKISLQDEYEIKDNGKYFDATREECLGLEPIIVWQPQSVEERLRDHYAGRKNIAYEYYRVK